MSTYGRDRICRTPSELKEALLALAVIPEKALPIRIHVQKEREKRKESKNRLLNAHIRDIARWKFGIETVPERMFDKVVNDTRPGYLHRRSHIWSCLSRRSQ